MRTVVHFVALHSNHVIIKDEQVTILMNLGQIKLYSRDIIIQTLLEAQQCIEDWIPVDCQLIKEEDALKITEESRPYSSDVEFIFDQSRPIYRVTPDSEECFPEGQPIYLYWRINIPVVIVRGPYDDDVFQGVQVALLSGVDPVYYTTLNMSSWHSAYPELLGALGPLFRHANTFPWNIVTDNIITGDTVPYKQFRLFLYPLMPDLDAQWHMGRQLEAIHASSDQGSLLGCVLHELRWDDWFLSICTHEVMSTPGYGLLIVSMDNPFWTDEHATALMNEEAFVNDAHPSMSLDQMAKHLAMGMAKEMEAIDQARGTLEEWLSRNEAMVIRRQEMKELPLGLDPVSEDNYNAMKAHVPAMLGLAYRSYLVQYD
jgi:hypothetical protein